MFQTRLPLPHGVYVVKDPLRLLLLLAAAVLLSTFAVFHILTNFWLSALAICIAVGLYFHYRAHRSGTVVDLNKGTCEFGGGGVSPNEVSDLFAAKFWLQPFTRFTVHLGDINGLTIFQRSNSRWDSQAKEIRTSTSYYIRMNGAFGAAAIRFTNQAKRDELYALICQANKMGLPVVSR